MVIAVRASLALVTSLHSVRSCNGLELTVGSLSTNTCFSFTLVLARVLRWVGGRQQLRASVYEAWCAPGSRCHVSVLLTLLAVAVSASVSLPIPSLMSSVVLSRLSFMVSRHFWSLSLVSWPVL